MNSAALTVTTLLCILIFITPRKLVLYVFLAGVCWIPAGPRIFLGPADFPAYRLLICAVLVRIFLRKEKPIGPVNKLDKIVIVWSVITFCTGTILYGSVSGFINRLGALYDSAIVYYLFRVYINDLYDIKGFAKIMGFILLPIGIAMAYEIIGKYNVFSIFGGVDQYPIVRGVHFRARGPFGHPILAGNVAAISTPFFYFLARSKEQNNSFYGYMGIIVAFIMIIMCGSSGPILTFAVCALGVALWRQKKNIHYIIRFCIIAVIFLQLIMDDPIWYAAARIDLAGGSTGWHRARLISSALEHFGEWWLIGTEYTRHWMPTGVSWSPNHTDITNQYILIGINGGIFSVVSFILMIRMGFKCLGEILNKVRLSEDNAKLVWYMGAILFCHTVSFLSIAYFDQTISFFYGLLAMISSLYSYFLRDKDRKKIGTFNITKSISKSY